MTVEQLDQIGKRVAKQVEDEYPEVVVSFSAYQTRVGGVSVGGLIGDSDEGSGETEYLMSAEHASQLLGMSTEQVANFLKRYITMNVKEFMQTG